MHNSPIGVKSTKFGTILFYAHNNLQKWGHRENGVLETYDNFSKWRHI